MSTIQDLIKLAKYEEGYLEKKSNKDLDDKYKNAGSNNYTKYARDLDKIKGFYNGKKNGYAWCDVFVDWLFVQTFGVTRAKELLNHGTLGAGCKYSADYYKKKNQYHTKPKVGDQIFFTNSKGSIAHTGIVIDVDNTYVYTIEGNTSSASGVVANGGSVRSKKYKLTYKNIDGYGRPNYSKDEAAEKVIKEETFEDIVGELQTALNKEYNAKLVVDKKPGPKTLSKTPTLNKKTRAKKPKTVKAYQKLLTYHGYGTEDDGDFYTATEKATKNFQKEKLGYKKPDGEATKKGKTWKKLLKLI